MNDIIDYVMRTPENTNPAILNQKLEEYAARNGAVKKPVFFISSSASADGGWCVSYYDNPDKLATVEEVVDAYMADTAYVVIDDYDGNKFPNKIVGFYISDQSSYGQVMPSFVDSEGYMNRFISINGSKEQDLTAAMAKYLP